MFNFTNINYFERFVRIVIGIVLLCTFLLLPDQYALLALIGLLPVLIGIVGWCPVQAWLEKYRNNGS